MQIKISQTVLLLCLALLSSCSDDGEGNDQVYKPTFGFYVRFLSPTGTNVLDSLGVCEGSQYPVKTSDEDIELTCISSWKGNPVHNLGLAWWKIPENYQHTYGDVWSEGTVLSFAWVDQLFFSDRLDYLDLEYLITMHSRKIFKDDKPHTIKWYLRVLCTRCDAYKCEVEGREYSLVDDPIYNYWSPFWKPENFAPFTESESSRIHQLGGIITINIEK